MRTACFQKRMELYIAALQLTLRQSVSKSPVRWQCLVNFAIGLFETGGSQSNCLAGSNGQKNRRKNEDQKKKFCAKIRSRSKYLVFFRRYNLTSYREKQVIYVAKYRLFYHISRKTEMGMNTKLARPDLALTTRC